MIDAPIWFQIIAIMWIGWLLYAIPSIIMAGDKYDICDKCYGKGKVKYDSGPRFNYIAEVSKTWFKKK